jgi:Uma2 family endonuclease
MDALVTRLDRRLPHEWDTRYELIAGVLHISRRASFEHQAFVARLVIRIGPAVLDAGGHVVQEPGLVWDDEGDDSVAPDLAVLLRVPRPSRGEKLRRCPEIVVEVMSGVEGDRRRDLVEKRDLYLRRGALEYWIADLPASELLRLVRAGDAWREERLGPSDRLATPLLPRWDGVVLRDLLE